jgi:hypothetical protein
MHGVEKEGDVFLKGLDNHKIHGLMDTDVRCIGQKVNGLLLPKRREFKMAKVFVMRYNKGKLPPSAITDEFKQQVGGALEAYLKDNPGVKFNGLYVNEEGVGICDWEAPDAETVKKFIDGAGGAYDEIVAVEKLL